MILCWNCNSMYDQHSVFCPICEEENRDLNVLCEEEEQVSEEDECCTNCRHFDIDAKIQCQVLKSRTRWERDVLEIDEPEGFKCGGYSVKISE